MKQHLKTIIGLFAVVLFMTACNKVSDLPKYESGNTPVLSASNNVIAPASADSNNVVLTLNWTDPGFATSPANCKYQIQVDSSGRNFSKAVTRELFGKLTTAFAAKELNAILIGFGLAYNTAYDVDIRLIASYSNNNDRKISNVVKVNYKTYLTPPKVTPPASGKLYITGSASTFNWTNPSVMEPARTFGQLSNTSWGAVFYMNAGGLYKVLQTPGDWSSQFRMVNGGTALAGSFIQEDADPAFLSPAPSGWYRFFFDFQSGTYRVSAFENNLPQELYVTGNADFFPNQWTNNPPASQKFTRVSSAVYELTIPLTPGKVIKFLSSAGNWQPQFGGGSAPGVLGANYGGGNDPNVINTPDVAGNYKITVDFYNNTYKLELQ